MRPNFSPVSGSEIQKMTTHEPLAAMAQLLDALSRDTKKPISPSWHEAVLTKRKERMNSAEARFFTLDQLGDQFRRYVLGNR